MKILLVKAILILTLINSFGQVPQTLSYQGLLTDNSGVPVADGSYAVTFRFYSAATGGTAIATRGPLTVNTFKGLFMTILGDGTTDNAALPFSLAEQEFFVGVTVSPSTTELSPRIKITAIPYAFVANSVKNVDANVINSGTLSAARIADNSITNAKLATGIDAAKLTGTLALANGGTGASTSSAARTNLGLVIGTDVQAFDADLTDLADGTLTGSKIGTGISATNITTGTLSSATISLTGTDASKLASGTTAQRPSTPVEGQLRYNTTEKVMEYYNGTNWYFIAPKVVIIKDLKSNGVPGGNYNNGLTWQTRDLNTIEGNASFVSLSANQFILSPGEYIIEATAPGYSINLHRIRLRNITTSSTIALGSNEYAWSGGQGYTTSYLFSTFTITSTCNFEIQHHGESAFSNGLGGASNASGVQEQYTQVKITKLR